MRGRLVAMLSIAILAIGALTFVPVSTALLERGQTSTAPAPSQTPKPPVAHPGVAQALGAIVHAKEDIAIKGAYACCIKPGCNFCPLAADKCPCRSNVKTPTGVCGECKAGWEAGVGQVEGVNPQNVQQIKGDMLKMMYSMRGPREEVVSGAHQHEAPAEPPPG